MTEVPGDSAPPRNRRTQAPRCDSDSPTVLRRRRSLSDEIRDAIAYDFVLGSDAGTRLPTEAALGDRYGVSRITVRSAIRSLRQAGLIDVRHGIGSTVLPRATLPAGLDRLASLETFARDQGQSVGTAQLAIRTSIAGDALHAQLNVPVGAETLRIERVKVYNEVRVAWIIDYVPEGVLPFETITKEFDGSVLDVLLAHSELAVDHSDCEIQAVALPSNIAALLEVPTSTAAIYMRELTRAASGKPLNLSEAWLLPEHFRLRVRRLRPLEPPGLPATADRKS